MNFTGAFDLNVPFNGKSVETISKEWYSMNYRTIAINQTIDLTDNPKKKKKGEKSELSIPEPLNTIVPLVLSRKMKILNRLTIKINDASHFPKIFQGESSICKKFNIIAVSTDDQDCFVRTIGLNQVDLISIDCLTRPAWRLTKKNYNSILEQNKYFELCYAPTFVDKSICSNTIFISHILFTIGRSRNVVISSGAINSTHLRTSHEVIHLSLLFGMDQNKARNCIITAASALIDRALKRQMGKSVYEIKVQ